MTVGTPTFGIFDHIEDIPGTPASRLFADRLALLAMADEAGFSGYFCFMLPTGDMTLDEAKRTLDLFITEVKPQLEQHAVAG